MTPWKGKKELVLSSELFGGTSLALQAEKFRAQI
jgi:hypothetical protein